MDYLQKARALARTLPPEERIKLHREKCFSLQEELGEALARVEDSCRGRVPALYRDVFKDLHLLVQRVKAFVVDCCYDIDRDFPYAAIRATAHKERFFQYRVHLEWIVFWVEFLGDDASLHGKRQFFNWEQELKSLRGNTSNLIAADERHLKDLLKSWIEKPGEQQLICWNLLQRLEPKTVLDTLPGDLGLPPVPYTPVIESYIGSGGFGTVWEMKWEEQLFAVKFINIGDAETINSEVKILEDCCHPHIVNLIHAYKRDKCQFLMMERLSMDLQSYVEERKVEKTFPFEDLEVVDMISQVCEGMLYLDEQKKVSHRDLKPKNILVKENLDTVVQGSDRVIELQVADFGLAKVRKTRELGMFSASDSNTPNMGTTLYRAPEMTVEPGSERIPGSSMKADMYSFAMTCSYILTGKEPLKDQYETIAARAEAIKRGDRPVLPKACPPALSSLLQQCWHPRPAERPSNFSAILTKLRELKEDLLITSARNRSGEGDNGSADIDHTTVNFNSGDRPLRILALGDSELVAHVVRQICGTKGHRVEDHVNLTERLSLSPPMCVYGDTKGIGYNFKDIQSFVESRNSTWHQRQMKVSWMTYLQVQNSIDTLFGDSTLRLHMVWFVCRTAKDLPDDFQWKEITRKLCGLPVQILVIGTTGNNEDLDSQFDNIVGHGRQFFPEDHKILEELIVKVDTTAHSHWKEKLWHICWTVKTKAEIETAAMTITTVREKLGSYGVSTSVGFGATISPTTSLSLGGEFVLKFLCTYWNIPQDAVRSVLQKSPNFEGTSSQREQNKLRRFSINPREFVCFCLRVAVIILDNVSNPLYEYRWFRPELLDKEAQDCCRSYFDVSNFSEYDQMKFGDVRVFLHSVFERKGRAPSPLVEHGKQSVISRFRKSFSSRGKSVSPNLDE